MDIDKTHIKTYRHKFNDELSDIMKAFSKVHQYDDLETFKEAFNEWYSKNLPLISSEEKRIVDDGYIGDVKKKIYSSVRYYYRKKGNKKTVSKRRIYISINSDILDAMDLHISTSYRNGSIKPADAYAIFLEDNMEAIKDECGRFIKQYKITKETAYEKMKKTYKNRHYIFKRNATAVEPVTETEAEEKRET